MVISDCFRFLSFGCSLQTHGFFFVADIQTATAASLIANDLWSSPQYARDCEAVKSKLEGFAIIDVNGEGNCLFDSVAVHLRPSSVRQYGEELRQLTATTYSSRPDIMLELQQRMGGSTAASEYVNNMRKSKQYAELFDIYALEAALNIHIEPYQLTHDGQLKLIPEVTSHGCGKSSSVYKIFFHSQKHYSPIVRSNSVQAQYNFRTDRCNNDQKPIITEDSNSKSISSATMFSPSSTVSSSLSPSLSTSSSQSSSSSSSSASTTFVDVSCTQRVADEVADDPVGIDCNSSSSLITPTNCHNVFIILAHNGINQPRLLTQIISTASESVRARAHFFHFIDDECELPEVQAVRYSGTAFQQAATSSSSFLSHRIRLKHAHSWGSPDLVLLHRQLIRLARTHLESLGVSDPVRHWFLLSGSDIPVKPLEWFFNNERFRGDRNVFGRETLNVHAAFHHTNIEPLLETFGTNSERAKIRSLTIVNCTQWIVLTQAAADMYTDDRNDDEDFKLCKKLLNPFVTCYSNGKHPNGLHNPRCPIPDEWIPFALIRLKLLTTHRHVNQQFDDDPLTEFFYHKEQVDSHPVTFNDLDTPVEIPDNTSPEQYAKKTLRCAPLRVILKEVREESTTGFFRKIGRDFDLSLLDSVDSAPMVSSSSSSSS